MEVKFDDVIEYLAGQCDVLDMDQVYWAHGGDESHDWCRSCCRYKVRNLRRRDKKNRSDYRVDGGWGSESDGVAVCSGCGELLEYSLTDSGVREELCHFLQYGPVDEDGSISPQTAHELHRVFSAGEYIEDVADDLLIVASQIRQHMSDITMG